MITLEQFASVVRTPDLEQPPARPPGHEAENAALRELMATLARAPGEVLQRLVEVAMEACGAESAGLSVAETDLWGAPVMRWWATAGGVAPLAGSVMSRDDTSCGLAVELGATQLLARPARVWSSGGAGPPPFEWVLCALFFDGGQAVGTLWVARHAGGAPFDGEDRRRLESLTGFAALVWDVRREATRLREAKAALDALNDELRAERAKLLGLVRDAPSFVAMLEGPELVYGYANEAYYRIVGHRPLIGLPLLEALPEMANQGLVALVRAVMDTNEPYVNREAPTVFQREPGGPLTQAYVDYVIQPAHGLDGAVTGVHIHGVDVTPSVLARRVLGDARG